VRLRVATHRTRTATDETIVARKICSANRSSNAPSRVIAVNPATSWATATVASRVAAGLDRRRAPRTMTATRQTLPTARVATLATTSPRRSVSVDATEDHSAISVRFTTTNTAATRDRAE
jgi:hypothetical protein